MTSMFSTWNDRNDLIHRLVGKKYFAILTMFFKCGRNSAKKLIPLSSVSILVLTTLVYVRGSL